MRSMKDNIQKRGAWISAGTFLAGTIIAPAALADSGGKLRTIS